VNAFPKKHEVILAELLEEIVRGEHPEGAKLPKETALAERFHVSRYVAREAIHALRDRGLVSVKHGVGQSVNPRHRWHLFDPVLLDAMFSGPEAKAARAEAAECAASVWPHVAALAAKRRKSADLKRLEAAEDAQELRNALAAAARNRFLGQVVSTLDAALPDDLDAYAAVVGAVREGDDGEARAAMSSIAGR
jgi:GntR family transcriptional repressor for pyruvate dehydrogenase complex